MRAHHQLSNSSQSPPPYRNNMQHDNQPINYNRPAEERMADFQQLVARYESKILTKISL